MRDRRLLYKQSRFLRRARQRRQRAAPVPPRKEELQIMDQDIQHLLSRCAIDIRTRLFNEDIRATYERDEEVTALIRMLTSGSAPLILGRPRAGKTALAYEVARRIVQKQAPQDLHNLLVYEVSPSSIVSGLQFGEGWRSNVAELFSKLNEMGNILIFFRDLHTAVGAGVRGDEDDDDDLAAALENVLRSRNILVIGEARPDRWQVIAADRDSFAELFNPYELPKLDHTRINKVLEQVAEHTSKRLKIKVDPESLQTAFDISQRFILNQEFPGKAIELLEDTLLMVQRAGHDMAQATHVVESFSARTGLTTLLLDDRESFNEVDIQRAFSERVLGQEPAVAAMVQKLALLKARMHDPARPMGVYLYLGPTGVGKTELARTLAAVLFGSEDRFVRFNMADYSGDYDFAQLFGRSWGDTDAERRGKLTMALINMPFAVLLLDEFEKAHPSIFNRFLQLFDEGLLVNAMGEEVNLRNTIIIMTSNFGASIVQGEGWGFAAREGMEAVERRVLRETEAFFSPEFINRLDGVTFFKPLSQSDMRRIAARELQKLFEREGLKRREIQVELDDAVLDILLKHGYSIRYGARYLKRQIEKTVSYPLASALLKDPERTEAMLRLYTNRDHIKAAWVDEDEEVLSAPEAQSPTATTPTTIDEAVEWLQALEHRLNIVINGFELEQAREGQSKLLEDMAVPSFWDDPALAQQKLIELSELARRVDRCNDLLRYHDEAIHLLERVQHGERRLFGEVVRVGRRLEYHLRFAELELLFNDAEDWNDAFIIIEGDQADSEWVRSLVSMYVAWAERRDIHTEVIDEAAPDETVTRVTLRCAGSGSFGLLRHEAGTHRVSERLNQEHPRQRQITQITVQVFPIPGEDVPAIPQNELDISQRTIHEQGHFMQRLRCVVRVNHLPSGQAITITSSHERQAREHAILLLQARIIATRLRSTMQPGAEPWGSVVRSYTFGKRSYIKDPRTHISSTNPRDVLTGNIDPFIEAALQQRTMSSEKESQ